MIIERVEGKESGRVLIDTRNYLKWTREEFFENYRAYAKFLAGLDGLGGVYSDKSVKVVRRWEEGERMPPLYRVNRFIRFLEAKTDTPRMMLNRLKEAVKRDIMKKESTKKQRCHYKPIPNSILAMIEEWEIVNALILTRDFLHVINDPDIRRVVEKNPKAYAYGFPKLHDEGMLKNIATIEERYGSEIGLKCLSTESFNESILYHPQVAVFNLGTENNTRVFVEMPIAERGYWVEMEKSYAATYVSEKIEPLVSVH